MKRSKLFLRITAALLAIAGVVAAKHSSGARIGYYITHGNIWCAQTIVPCTIGGTLHCQLLTRGGHQIPVFSLGPTGPYSSANPINCRNEILYDGEN
jgi:hypothetical protein